MAGYVTVDSSHHGVGQSEPQGGCYEEPHDYGARWYFTRKEIEEFSPSRRDGIDLKKETCLRKSYCTFLQELGMRLQVPQVTIATAMVFCHRFFLRQSHAKNDKMTIATVCMFLAGKVEETPRPLKDVILVSYETIHKKGPFSAQKIRHKEVYERQKELILLGERLVLATLGFDLNVRHPYKPLVDAIKTFKVAKSSLAKVAWNFVNDGFRTSLCLQYNPHHIAAGAIFLAAKFIKVKLPSDGEKAWWHVFDVNPRQLEDVSNQLLELYEQHQATQPSHCNEANGSSCAGINHLPTGTTTSTVSESSASVNNAGQGGQPPPPLRPIRIQQSNADSKRLDSLSTHNHNNGHGSSADCKSGGVCDYSADCNGKDGSYREAELVSRRRESSTAADLNSSKHDRVSAAEVISAGQGGQPPPPLRPIRIQQFNADSKRLGSLSTHNHSNSHGSSADGKSGGLCNYSADCNEKDGSYGEAEQVSCHWESSTAEDLISSKRDGGSAAEVISAVEKVQKLQNDAAEKNDLIEKQVEDEIKLAMEDEKMIQVKRRWPKPLHKVEQPLPANIRRQCKEEDGNQSSLDVHNYSSRQLQSNNLEVSGALKRKPDEKLWSDHSGRDQKRFR